MGDSMVLALFALGYVASGFIIIGFSVGDFRAVALSRKKSAGPR